MYVGIYLYYLMYTCMIFNCISWMLKRPTVDVVGLPHRKVSTFLWFMNPVITEFHVQAVRSTLGGMLSTDSRVKGHHLYIHLMQSAGWTSFAQTLYQTANSVKEHHSNIHLRLPAHCKQHHQESHLRQPPQSWLLQRRFSYCQHVPYLQYVHICCSPGFICVVISDVALDFVYWNGRLTPGHQSVLHNFLLKNSYLILFLISSFRRVLYVVCFLLGNSPASGVYIPYKLQTPGNYPKESIQLYFSAYHQFGFT